MTILRIVGQPQPEDDWLHRFRNFGEDVYVQLRDAYAVNLHEIDAAIDTFHVRDIPADAKANVVATLGRILADHHLGDSVFVLPHDGERSGPTVVLVVDTTFGERLWQIAAWHDTWVVPSDVNRAVVEQIWRERAEATSGPSVTVWSGPTPAVTERDWLDILDTIEVHHGSFWCEPPLDILSVYGGSVTSGAATALQAYEYDIAQPTKAGFVAIKRHPA